MTQYLSLLALVLVAVTMGLALAHALEFPGKLRLDEAGYRQVQEIYYPGFTIGGLVGEFGALLLLPVLLLLTPYGSERFWWTAGAFACLLLCHLVYWVVTHPVNAAWLKDSDLSGLGAAFFGQLKGEGGDWRQMRNLWELSHLARAILAMAGLVAMAVSVSR